MSCFLNIPRRAAAGTTVNRRGSVAAVLLALSLAACGGGGGSAPDSGASPSPPPTATPAPAPTPSPSAFGALGQTASQKFAVLGFGYRGSEVGGWGDFAVERGSVDPALGLGLRYVAPGSALRLAIGGFGEDTLVPNGGSGTDGQGRTTHLSYNVLGGNGSISLLPNGRGSYLAFVATGGWLGPLGTAPGSNQLLATFVYGVPTTADQMPRAGTAAFEARNWGPVAIGSRDEPVVAYAEAVVRLVVDFAARTVTGTMEVSVEGVISTYTIAQGAFTSDGAGFQLSLFRDGVAAEGFIEGRFAGPQADELMVRWQAPVQVGARTGPAFGVAAAARG